MHEWKHFVLLSTFNPVVPLWQTNIFCMILKILNTLSLLATYKRKTDIISRLPTVLLTTL
jgi:hypothetical protein